MEIWQKLKSASLLADLRLIIFTVTFLHCLKKKTKKMARETGLEPATSTVTGWHSNQLSYSPAFISGVDLIEVSIAVNVV